MTAYLEAEANVQGGEAYVENADHLDAQAIAFAIREGDDNLGAAAHHRRDAEEQLRIQRHALVAHHRELGAAFTRLFGALRQHRDEMAALVLPTAQQTESEVLTALRALQQAHRRHRAAVDVGVFWDQLSASRFPSFGSSPREAEKSYAGGAFTVTDATAARIVSDASMAGLLDESPADAA